MTSFPGRALAAACALAVVTGAGAACAQNAPSLFNTKQTASVTYGPYVRFALGAAKSSPDNGYWRPTGYPEDPEVWFDLSGETTGMAEIATGFDWQNGWRADFSFLATGTGSVSGPCSGASDASSCDIHADISAASIATRAALFNVFYAPFEAGGSHSAFQPFIVAGIGAATNEVGQWTRYNDNTDVTTRTTKTFEGNSSVSPVWSVGVGAAQQVTKPGKWPVLVEFAVRYYDFGEASGSATPLPDNGSSEPVQPLTFDNHQTVATLGVRIPMQRY